MGISTGQGDGFPWGILPEPRRVEGVDSGAAQPDNRRPMSRFDLYDHPRWYDILFARGSAATVAGLRRVARDWTRPAGRPTWLEPACGTGRLLVPAARRGVSVTGYDRNRAMVAWARERLRPFGRSAQVIEADLVDAHRRLGARRFDLAFTLDNSLRHLPDDDAVARHLASTARLLEPTGAYVVGLSFHDPARAAVSEDIWSGRRGATRVTQMVQFDPPPAGSRRRHETVIEHVEVSDARGPHHHDAVWRLLVIDRRRWKRLVGDSPFDWVATLDATGAPIEPGVFDYQWIVLQPARRRGSGRTAPARPPRKRTA
jgi:SAM-dependent methyltransferase